MISNIRSMTEITSFFQRGGECALLSFLLNLPSSVDMVLLTLCGQGSSLFPLALGSSVAKFSIWLQEVTEDLDLFLINHVNES